MAGLPGDSPVLHRLADGLWRRLRLQAGAWLDKLSDKERAEYDRLFPHPVFWDDLSVMEDDEDMDPALLYDGEDYFLRHWRPNGEPAYDRKWLERQYIAGKS